MSRPRRRMFGPLFYTTAAAAVFLLACAELDSCGPIVAEWLRERSLIRALQADDSRQRDAAVVALIKMGSTKIVPHLLEAAHDSRGECASAGVPIPGERGHQTRGPRSRSGRGGG